ncbi:MAG: polyprenyl synthetase family protein [Candidatus Kapabacteria bacterium]|nr:polyprenyl synthetase family protein [Candidatus Kapabacteria bacterium]MCS7169505.1 polyprenyl synthetase family protein [Candidatus Kapabacteria bacterium]MDW7996435.1 polyprenyl synthetase family protein [Bacteroidota bacterium]MDW8224510.1 polyprenyl synthetase family protein [Bacteroidota bacterium]
MMTWCEGPPEQVYRRLQNAVEQTLQGVVQSLHHRTVLLQTVPYVLQLPGKRVRPLLCLLASALEGAEPWDALPAAAAVEILHAFTLVHDDIMDRSLLRRGQPTVHTRWDEPVAILTGDVLVGLAYQLMERYAGHSNFEQLISILTRALIDVSEGQALDLELPARPRPVLEDYWRMIDGKTAALLRVSLLIGALLANVSARTQTVLQELAVPLGRAFQLQDDLLDLVGETNQTGKQVGQDLREGKYTYAVLRALELAPESVLLQRYRECRGASEAELPALLQLFQQMGIFSEIHQHAEQHYARVFALLDQLPETPARDLLRSLVEQLRQRRR